MFIYICLYMYIYIYCNIAVIKQLNLITGYYGSLL